ncbi:hypothetical protein HMPREF3171_07240 [Corynebacterium sp. HMSC08F01]|uniref:HNH endonuclease signature motif containing protein n=1 Tax=Corynebacterium TaxID=1716 RepID=UPI0008A6215E|nr:MULTISPECIES: DUF222 domain-containing protein [Corynebacterium]MDK8822387.1 DUF222 domain-containing protein [Corynebacterium coyleae]OFT29431.1 hypothetical protein HMPREF3171_07240 [Corynebacterium sp. HMSC08F01]OHO34017.1 hypothetical protein HMPREF2690_05415 [Corynebacterium sp. HMSC034E11]
MTTIIDQHVNQITAGLEALSNLMMEPDSLHLLGTHQAIERLHGSLPLLGNVNAAFAHLCTRDNAGSLVGANHPVEYLTQRLGLSRAQAFDLLNHGKRLFGEPDIPVPPTNPEQTEEDKRAAEEEAQRRKEQEKKAQERARKAAREKKASEEKKRIISNALKDLNEHANPGYLECYSQAMEAAARMTPEELRKFVTDLVRKANRAGLDYEKKKDPLAAFKKRGISFGPTDADGGSYARLYLDAASRAKFEAALAAGEAPGSHLPDGSKDTRTKQQRRFDQLMHILDNYSQARITRDRGIGTVVVTLTLEDLVGADWQTRFSTNTSVDLTALDILHLGLAGDTFALQLDSATGVPLSLGRARLASIEQRLVLLATQGVCAWNGCTKPGVELEAHHLQSYLHGGVTDLNNLILLCREHHRCNNDNRDGAGGKGHFEKDPDTWDITHHPADGGPPTTTSTWQFEQSPGQRHKRKIRDKHPSFDDQELPGTDPPLFAPDTG